MIAPELVAQADGCVVARAYYRNEAALDDYFAHLKMMEGMLSAC